MVTWEQTYDKRPLRQSKTPAATTTWATFFSISSKSSFICTITDRITHTMTFVTPVVEHWLERVIAQWVHHKGSIQQPITHNKQTLYHRANISLPIKIYNSRKFCRTWPSLNAHKYYSSKPKCQLHYIYLHQIIKAGSMNTAIIFFTQKYFTILIGYFIPGLLNNQSKHYHLYKTLVCLRTIRIMLFKETNAGQINVNYALTFSVI